MNSHSMLHGILDLFEACSPDGSGTISSEAAKRGMNILIYNTKHIRCQSWEVGFRNVIPMKFLGFYLLVANGDFASSNSGRLWKPRYLSHQPLKVCSHPIMSII